jgi:tetratricopeptide (TPR) repeat protein
MQQAIDRRRAGDLSGARELASLVLRERPDMTAALLQLALIERDLGDIEGATGTLERAVANDPADPNPAVLLAGLMGEAGQAARGLSLLTPWLGAPEPLVEVLTTRGVLLARLGRHAEALASFARARELDPSSAMTLVQIATVHLATGDRARARAALEEALRSDPELALAHRQLGLLSLAERDAAEAERRFRAALGLDPDEADALLNLGRLLLARERAGVAALPAGEPGAAEVVAAGAGRDGRRRRRRRARRPGALDQRVPVPGGPLTHRMSRLDSTV